jgi:hypothetical protein
MSFYIVKELFETKIKEMLTLKSTCLTNKPEPDLEPKINEKSDPDPKKFIIDAQHWL